MSWKCEKCGQILKGRENYCPNCAEKAIYRCKVCDKEMENGVYEHCPVCRTVKKEKRDKAIKTAIATAGAAVGAAASAVFLFVKKR